MLPLTPANNYTAEIILCGGSDQNDQVAPSKLSAQAPAISSCKRMRMDAAGIAAGWQSESMESSRVMGEFVMLPDGRLLLVNGAQTGAAGYGNRMKGSKGASNADNPALQPLLYDPSAPIGSRFSSAGIPRQIRPRMYHSSATLLPNGQILIAGSNPNDGVTSTSKNNPYGTDYSFELLSPVYMSQTRPTISSAPSKIGYGSTYTMTVTLPSGTKASDVLVNLMELGYHTHGLAFDQRMVQLVVSDLSPDGKTLTVVGPPNARVFPPGVAYAFVLADGVPSIGKRVTVGDGSAPPSSAKATDAMLAKTRGKYYRYVAGGKLETSAP